MFFQNFRHFSNFARSRFFRLSARCRFYCFRFRQSGAFSHSRNGIFSRFLYTFRSDDYSIFITRVFYSAKSEKCCLPAPIICAHRQTKTYIFSKISNKFVFLFATSSCPPPPTENSFALPSRFSDNPERVLLQFSPGFAYMPL